MATDAANSRETLPPRPRPTARRAVIELEHVRKVYARRGQPVEALADVSFTVGDNEFVSIVGRSGCGKTSILKMVAGLLSVSSGTITVRGQRVTGPQRQIGMVFQAPVLPPWRTILDNVLLPIEMLDLDVAAHRPRALELLELVGLKGFEGRYPRELSGGMQQRASIVRALVHDPRLLLMDEPFGALDAITREEMNLELLRIWTERQKTTLLVTHSISEAVFLSDRVVIMTARPGRVADEILIDLPRPRHSSMKSSPRFLEYVETIGRRIGMV
jgi:NitT/TauT family transport system ATP-binding protein